METQGISNRSIAATILAVALVCALDGCDGANPRPQGPVEDVQEFKLAKRAYSTGDTLWSFHVTDTLLVPTILQAKVGTLAWSPEPDGSYRPTITSPPGSNSIAGIDIPLDVRPWRGLVVILGGQIKAQGVNPANSGAIGVKMNLGYSSASLGTQYSMNLALDSTFDWTTLAETLAIAGDAVDGHLLIGLQSCRGMASFRNLSIRAAKVPPVRPPPHSVLTAVAGHGYPRLRAIDAGQSSLGGFDSLASWNVNGVRWIMSGGLVDSTDPTAYSQWLQLKFADLDKALAQAAPHGIKFAICLVDPPGGRLNGRTLKMVLDSNLAETYLRAWEAIATRYKGSPMVWAYDLINEPVQDIPSPNGVRNWWDLQIEALRRIRSIDPTTTVILESDAFDVPTSYQWMAAAPYENLVYEAHMYYPHPYTHQGIHGSYTNADILRYPGPVGGSTVNADSLRNFLRPLRDFQLAYDVPIFIGEFSVARWAPGGSQYLSDCIHVFEEYGWDWSYLAFRGASAWDLEIANLPADTNLRQRSATRTDRWNVVDSFWRMNVRTGP